MDVSLDEMDDGEIDWSQPANLPPYYLRTLGDKLTSPTGIQGPCWETVADALNFDNEKRNQIAVNAARLQMSEGHALLYDWTSRNNDAHSLQVLRTALQSCNRDDIMDEFMKGVKRMHEVTLHVVVIVPQDLPDPETRPQAFKVTVNCTVTLANAIGSYIDNIHDYEISVPKYATWQSQAKKLKGNQITITKKHPREDTGLEQLRSSFQDTAIKETRISNTTANADLILNIVPNELSKGFNNDLNELTPRCTNDELNMQVCTSCECNNSSCADSCDSSIGLTPFLDLKVEGQSKLPRKEPNGTSLRDMADSRTKRPRQSDDESEDSNEDRNTDIIPNQNQNQNPSFPKPDKSSLVRRFTEPGMSKRVKASVYIPWVTQSFERAGLPYWHGKITMEEMQQRMAAYLLEDGCFMVWSYKGATERDNKLVISVTHARQLLHYNIRARAVDGRMGYYLFKKEYASFNALNLIEYYSRHSLESRSNTGNGRDIKLQKPVGQRMLAKVSPLPYFYVGPN